MSAAIFVQLSVILGITAVFAWVAKLLKQPLMIAYLAAGIVSGPVLLNFIDKNIDFYQTFAQFGVVLLLFVVGLSLNFTYIKKIGKIAVFTGLGQAVFTIVCGWVLLQVLHFPPITALYLAIASTFSSTIIITKLLADKKHTDSVYGRYTVGLLLVQDVIAIIIVIFLSASSGTESLAQSLALFALKLVVAIIFIAITARFILPFILQRIAHSSEFLFLFTLAWCFGITSLVNALGFSLETGALMAGLALGSSSFQAEIASRVKPLRDFFLILFFVILGSQLSLSNIRVVIGPAIIFSCFVLIGNPLILYTLFRLSKFTRRNSFLVGLTAAQVSEFGFVLLFTGQRLGVISKTELGVFTAVALITIFVSSYLITYNEWIFKLFMPWFALFGKDKHVQTEENRPVYDTWLIGAHRIGWRICQVLKHQKISFAVIDYNPETIAAVRAEGIPAYFGDGADVEFLTDLPLEKAKLIISTIPDPHDQITFIKHVRTHSKKTYIVANLVHVKFRDALYSAGADYVMMPHVLGGGLVAGLIKKHKLTKKIFRDLRKEQEEEIKLGFIV
jgi:Kef-type K+ transport system membrane component KefB